MMESSIARFTWTIWPWMNWLVPAFVCLHGLFGNGGWESLVLIPASVVLVPGTALLGALPRFLLRRQGVRQVPLSIVPLLFLVWWGWFCVGAAMPGATDSAPLPSILNAMTGERLPSVIETALMFGGAAVAVASWLAILTIVLMRTPRPRTDDPAPERGQRAGVVVAWAAAFVIPAVLAASCVAGVQLQSSAVDADGDTAAVVEARDRATRDELDRQRYETTQRALSEVRTLIAPSDWTGAEARATSSRQCPWMTAATACYALDVRFVHEVSGPPDFSALARSLTSAGWETGEPVVDEWGATELEVRSPDGVAVTVRHSRVRTGEQFVNVSATSPSWWGASFEVVLQTSDTDPDVRYAASDYPAV